MTGPTAGDEPGSRQPASGHAPCGHAACAGLPHCAAYLGHAVPPWFPPKQARPTPQRHSKKGYALNVNQQPEAADF